MQRNCLSNTHNNMEDIIRKQIKDVTIPQNDIVRRPQTAPEPYVAPIRDDEGDRIGKNPFFERHKKKIIEPQKGNNSNKGVLFALLFVFFLVAGFFIANYFALATIDVKPIARGVQIDNNFTATVAESEGELTFHFTSLSEVKEKEVPATIEKKIQKKASGKITIFNSYNGDSQRLIKNTRLESASHKIFRIDQSVVVPGVRVVDGKTVPGSVNVVVYADVAGDGYNIKEPSDFTIPGFKGDPRYTKFKAMTIPESPISGGFSGTVKVPSDEAIKQAQEDLKQDLKKITVEKIRAEIPSDVSFFPGSIIVRFEEVPQDFSVSDITNVSMRAIVSVFFFDTAELTKKIAELLPPEDKVNPFSITNMSSLDFKFDDTVDNVVLSDLEKIRFHIAGKANFVGQIDAKKIVRALAGKSKKDFNEIIKNQINIASANAVVRPMWKTVFPSDPSKITVKIATK